MKDKMLRLVPYEKNGREMVDLRYWLNTDKGPRSIEEEGLSFEITRVPRLIAALQKLWSESSSDAAHAARGER